MASKYSDEYKRKFKEETGQEFRVNNPHMEYIDELEKKAGGNLTILDLIRENKKDDAFVEFGGIQAILDAKNPTGPKEGGTYKGSVYYSNILPQGEGDIPWSKEAATIVNNASQTGAKKSDILAAENYFVDIGYMHPSEVDGKKGKQVMGMIRRWNLNAGTSKEAMFDAMETWKDRLFDGGAEDFEEDFREGGGDQGGY